MLGDTHKTCTQIPVTEGVCNDNGDQWFSQHANCCSLNLSENTSNTLQPLSSVAVRNDHYKLLCNSFINTARVSSCGPDEVEEFYRINENQPFPLIERKDLDLLDKRTPEEETNLRALRQQLREILESEPAPPMETAAASSITTAVGHTHWRFDTMSLTALPPENSATASGAAFRQRSSPRRSARSALAALLGVAIACAAEAEPAAAGPKGAAPAPPAASAPGQAAPYGWYTTNAGDPDYEKYGPRELTNNGQLNQPIGEAAAERIARGLGLDKSRVFTKEQFVRFVTGTGNPPVPPSPFDEICPELADKSIRILTNTIGNPIVYKDAEGNEIATVLASYGLTVNEAGWLQSPANTAAPTRQVNVCLLPGGYLDRWAQANGATASIEMLNNSAYTSELPYGNQSQQEATAAQLVTNRKPSRSAVVGMSMPPALWNVNFSLIYTLNPKLAANMPARWAPIPQPVVDALEAATDPTTGEPTGQVRFDDYKSYFEGSWYPVR